MSFSRREFIRFGALTAALAATGCTVIGPQTAAQPGRGLLPNAQPLRPLWRTLNRIGYGPRPGDLERVEQLGLDTYIESQLWPSEISDTPADLIMTGLTLYHQDINQQLGYDPDDGRWELLWSTLARKLYSERQLYEAMVEFWSDHFHIYPGKNRYLIFHKMIDDRDVIRPHALGQFKDLLQGSLNSPAMLIYLDNIENNGSSPNENYARELLELHTLGVYGGYSQTDVQEVARMLTGLTVSTGRLNPNQRVFEDAFHDGGQKQALAVTYAAGGGEADLEDLVNFLTDHPSTAHFIATKLVRRFVSDDPPADLVETIATAFRSSGGDIKETVRPLFNSPLFRQPPPKLKRPFQFLTSALRGVNATVQPSRPLRQWVTDLGQAPYMWPTPDGYPDEAEAWANGLLNRWNFALAVAHEEIRGVRSSLQTFTDSNDDEIMSVNRLAGLLWGRSLTEAELHNTLAISEGTTESLRDSAALLLAAPEFQWI